MKPPQAGRRRRLDEVSAPGPSPAETPQQESINLADESGFDLHSLRADNGLSIRALPNVGIYAIDCNGILINQVLASPVAGGIQSVWLRLHQETGIESREITGPRAASDFAVFSDRLVWSGLWLGLHYRCTCWLHPGGAGWCFHIEVENQTDQTIRCDAVLVQDIGLATRGQVRNNEIFTSQYIDHYSTSHPEAGYLVMSRQNLPQPGDTHPWLLQGCFPSARGFTTDGFDFFGSAFKADPVPAALSNAVIGERICQYEAAYTAIQSSESQLSPSGSHAWTFFAHFLADHPEPSSPADADRLEQVHSMRQELARALAAPGRALCDGCARSLFQTCDVFDADAFDEADLAQHFPGERRHEELENGRLLSFFHGADSRHVILKHRELAARRPHGHIMRSGRRILPDAELMSCTAYAAGCFASQLALGNTSLGKLLSAMRDPLNLVRSSGLRIFVRKDATQSWQLLAVPSAFEMAPDQCRWHYKSAENLLTVSCVASSDDPAFTFELQSSAHAVELLICGEIAAGAAEYEHSPQRLIDDTKRRITIRPSGDSLLGQKQPQAVFHVVTPMPQALEQIGGDELLFPDGEARRLPCFVMQTRPTAGFSFSFLGIVNEDAASGELPLKYESRRDTGWRKPEVQSGFWSGMTAGVRLTIPSQPERAPQIQDALSWFARDALVHVSCPRGLEQPNAAAWGVRDVCQGPVEFLLSYDHVDAVADILRKVFSQQYHERWDWPQWFMFPPFEQMQSSRCHGDNLIWPLKALCDYLEHTNDGEILHERVGYADDQTFQPSDRSESLLEHCDRLLRRMQKEFLPGLSLPCYGDGDWDDTLQPADLHLRDKMVSSWTAELMYQSLRRYSIALQHFGHAERASAAESLAKKIGEDFQRYMMPDGIVAGFALFAGHHPKPVEYLLHPSDQRTGIHYRLIPMSRGILSGIFTPSQAQHHLELIGEHLLFPDGARLMDRPTAYAGGKQRNFRRAESAAFFGREIGLQYVHAHLRYAEALALTGRAEELWRALLVVNPIAVTEVVPNARPRQRNCYFSSSDAAFTDRYEASRNYDLLRRGQIPTDGGWRIYSSGPGIYTNLVIRHLLGIRRYFDWIEFDPVLPKELNGASCELQSGSRVIRYQFASTHQGPMRINVNSVNLSLPDRIENPHRPGGIRVRRCDFEANLKQGQNLVRIEV